ncbi:hypothetical protein GFV12_00815 [Desulfurobacterium thermolithotrophum]|nr:hypothetical protein [Desulfurobacterium thermolithotrophum]
MKSDLWSFVLATIMVVFFLTILTLIVLHSPEKKLKNKRGGDSNG